MKTWKSLCVFVLFAAFSVSVIGKSVVLNDNQVKGKHQILTIKVVVDEDENVINALHEDGTPGNLKAPNPAQVTWDGKVKIAKKKLPNGDTAVTTYWWIGGQWRCIG